MQHHQQTATTIAVLGADTVVGSALSALLGGHGYRTTALDSYPTGIVDELLDGADLLLLAPRVDGGVRDAFLGAVGKSAPERVDMPVIALRTAEEHGLPEKEGVLGVPWPCETKLLVERVEATLAGEGSKDNLAI